MPNKHSYAVVLCDFERQGYLQSSQHHYRYPSLSTDPVSSYGRSAHSAKTAPPSIELTPSQSTWSRTIRTPGLAPSLSSTFSRRSTSSDPARRTQPEHARAAVWRSGPPRKPVSTLPHLRVEPTENGLSLLQRSVSPIDGASEAYHRSLKELGESSRGWHAQPRLSIERSRGGERPWPGARKQATVHDASKGTMSGWLSVSAQPRSRPTTAPTQSAQPWSLHSTSGRFGDRTEQSPASPKNLSGPNTFSDDAFSEESDDDDDDDDDDDNSSTSSLSLWSVADYKAKPPPDYPPGLNSRSELHDRTSRRASNRQHRRSLSDPFGIDLAGRLSRDFAAMAAAYHRPADAPPSTENAVPPPIGRFRDPGATQRPQTAKSYKGNGFFDFFRGTCAPNSKQQAPPTAQIPEPQTAIGYSCSCYSSDRALETRGGLRHASEADATMSARKDELG